MNGHCGVDFSGQFDEAGAALELPGFPGQIERIDRNAVSAQPRSRIERHESKRFCLCRFDYSTQIGQTILDPRRHLGVYGSGNNPVSFEFTEVLGKHLLRGLWDRPLEIGESHGLVPGKMSEERHLPTPVNTAE